MQYLKKLLASIDRAAKDFRWTNTYGLARSLMALGLLITLLCNDIAVLIHPLGEGSPSSYIQTIDLAKINLFNLVGANLVLGKTIAIAILTLVLIGWYPKITGIFHWWVTFSFANSAMVLDGGDQIAQVLTLLLIPVCLADPRKWHWEIIEPGENRPVSFYQKSLNLLAYSSMLIIALQVALIYFHAGVGKLEIEEWANGTAMFYWIQNPIFGVDGEPHAELFYQLFANPYIVSVITWGVIVFEVVLFMALLMNKQQKKRLLILGITFHFLNIVLFGLVSFFFTMTAALLLYLGPHQTGIKWQMPVGKMKWERFFSQLPLSFNIKNFKL